ncbi:MAG: hypothetical protein RLZ83_381 [Pseudomonadota bacterium]
MKRWTRRAVCTWLVSATAIAGMSACAGTPTTAPQDPDTLAVWAAPSANRGLGVDAVDTGVELAAQAEPDDQLPPRHGVELVTGEGTLRADVAPSGPVRVAVPPASLIQDPAVAGVETAVQPHDAPAAQITHGLVPVSMRQSAPAADRLADLPALESPRESGTHPAALTSIESAPLQDSAKVPASPEGSGLPGGLALPDGPALPEEAGAAVAAPAPAPVPVDLWGRVRGGLAIADLDGPLVRHWERWYAERPDYFQRMTERAGRYLFHIVEEVERRGMPAELALLPFIESAFNPQALSVAKASGIWQFMPATGKDFDLTQNLFRDDRRHVLASTDAALSYLQLLHGMFGDWHLALAAYNWGQGNVQRALDRQSKHSADRPTYEQLSMPAETRNYVPKLQAIENLLRDPAAFGLTLPPLENHPYFLTVTIDRDIDVDLVSRLAGLSKDDFHALNPQLNKPVILAAATPEILLPYDNAQRFEVALAAHNGPRASWTAWVAPRTVHPRDAARQTGLSEARLREINRIPKGMLIRAGSTLLVPRPQERQSDVSPVLADTARISLAPDGPRLQRKVVRAKAQGERLNALASRYGVSARNVAAWNGLPVNAVLKPRQTVVLMLPARASKNAAKQTPAPTAKKPSAASVAKR